MIKDNAAGTVSDSVMNQIEERIAGLLRLIGEGEAAPPEHESMLADVLLERAELTSKQIHKITAEAKGKARCNAGVFEARLST